MVFHVFSSQNVGPNLPRCLSASHRPCDSRPPARIAATGWSCQTLSHPPRPRSDCAWWASKTPSCKGLKARYLAQNLNLEASQYVKPNTDYQGWYKNHQGSISITPLGRCPSILLILELTRSAPGFPRRQLLSLIQDFVVAWESERCKNVDGKLMPQMWCCMKWYQLTAT